MFRIAYQGEFPLEKRDDIQATCEEFVSAIHKSHPSLGRKVKVHLLLHLTQNMLDFGPALSFCTERYKNFTINTAS